MAEEIGIAFINGRFFRRKKNGESELTHEYAEEEEILRHKFDGPVARAKRGYGLTLNLGHFESARLDIGVELPCYIEDLDNADEYAEKWVENRIRKEAGDIRASQSNKKKPKPPSY